MVSVENRLKALEALGKELKSIDKDELDALQRKAFVENGWFEPKWVSMQLRALSDMLTEGMQEWRENYPDVNSPKRVGVIGAGNLPLVCAHDIISVLASGHDLVFKPSSEDRTLPEWFLNKLKNIESGLADHIEVRDDLRCELDAVLMTGSDNSVNHFKNYFKGKSLLCRGNRTSVAVLKGDESEQDMESLALDILAYFGRGCRNVGKVFVPQDFDLDRLFAGLFTQQQVIENKKYGNNYDYTRAIYLMEHIDFLENGFMILRESEELYAPTSVLYYERFSDMQELQSRLDQDKERIQVVVGRDVAFGEAQFPGLKNYADGKDVLSFLTAL